MGTNRLKQILILGGGFGGLYAAEEELNHMSNPASVMSGGSISKKVSNMSARTS